VRSRYYRLACHSSSEQLRLLPAKTKGVYPYLPRLNGLLETSFEASPPLHIIRIDPTCPERFDCTAYLIRPKYFQVHVTSLNLIKRKAHLIEQVKVFRK
jgi:hypothetical protein